MWTERDIREQTDEQTFYRGKLLESTNGVLEFSSFETEGVYGDKELNLRATIHGTNKNNYKVEVTLYYDEYGEPQDIDYYCPCEDFLTSDGICKHCVATILYYMHTDGQSKTVTSPFSMPLPLASEYDDRDTFYGNTSSVFSENSTVSQESILEHPARTDNSMQQILRQFGNQENWMITDGALIGRIHLEPTLDISGKTPSVSLRIGDKKMYVVKSIPELVQHVQQTEMHKYGKNLAFVHQLDAFDDNSRSLMSFFIRQYQDYNYWYSTDIRNFTLKNELLDAFIEIVADSGIMLEPSTKNQGLWYLTDEEYKKTLTLTAVEGGLELKLEQIPSVSSLDWNYIFKDQKIYHSSRHTHQAINLFEDRMTGWCGGKSFIAESDLPLFAREMLPELEKMFPDAFSMYEALGQFYEAKGYFGLAHTRIRRYEILLEFVREGDTIHVHDFSRLARSTKDLLDIVEQLSQKNIYLVSNKENIDTSTPTGKLMLTMIGAINEFERYNLLERQREGIAIAKRNGKYKGGKRKSVPDFENGYQRYLRREISKVGLAKELRISRPTLDKLIKEYTEVHTNENK